MSNWGVGRCSRALLVGGAFLLPMIGASGPAAAAVQAKDSARIRFEIPPQDLGSALSEFARQSDQQLLFPPDLVKGKISRGVSGEFTPRQGLERLLAGTGLRISTASSGAFLLAPEPATGNGDAAAAAASSEELLPASVAPEASAGITITGTRIRGGTTPSPMISITAEQMRQEGFTDLGNVVRALPQNFSGGQNPGIAAGAFAGGRANQNITGGSGLNLRGLGPDASLTLLNGRRLSYDGFAQVVDISAIPVDAVERIEILTDGASAIYGSDAVGGVANVILKPDFNGLTVSALYGGATDGGLATHEYAATAGGTWSGGGMIATVKRASNDPIYSDQRDYAKTMYTPSTLYQRGDLSSGLISAHQSLGGFAEVRVDALRSRRTAMTDTGHGATYERNKPTTDTAFVAPSIEFSLPGSWLLTVGGAWGKSETNVDYNVVTVATGSQSLSRPYYRNRTQIYEVGAEGPLFALPGGPARLALGAGYRHNDFLDLNRVSKSVSVDGEVSSRFAYAELNLPLVGPSLHMPGIHRLTATGALRTEHYDSFGNVTTPKLGLIYSPSGDFTLKGSWGKSFKVPTLAEQFTGAQSILFPASFIGGTGYPSDATAIYYAGGNPFLKPERARTWSGSLAIHPRRLRGFEAELTWFDINYSNRVVTPVGNPYFALSDPTYAPFITYAPTPAQLSRLFSVSRFVNAAGVPFDPAKVVAIASNVWINTAREHAKGLDLSGSYRFDMGAGRLAIGGSLTWLNTNRRISEASQTYDLSGTLFYPAKLSGRAGAVWSQGGFTASLFGNYRGGVTNTADGRKGGSFTTFDATVRYDTGKRQDMFSNLAFELSAQNMFDEPPPLYDTSASPANAPYDSTNYSAVGRFVSVSVSKHF
jgi:outer membrane receptor protein involved in Fe transport